CRWRQRGVQIVQLRRPFSFFSASCARVSQASAISSRACRSLPLIWLAMRTQSAAYFLNFSDSRNLASSVPAKGNAGFWNFVLQQFCDGKLRGTIGPGRDFYLCVSGRLGCRFFPPSITVDMPRNAGGWRNRSLTPATRRGSWTWLKHSENSPIKTISGTRPRPTTDHSPAAPVVPFFRLHGTCEGAAGFSGVVGEMPFSIAIPESRRCRERALECRTVADRLRLQNA